MGLICDLPYCPEQDTQTETRLNLDQEDNTILLPKINISENQESEKSLDFDQTKAPNKNENNEISEKSKIKRKSGNVEIPLDEDSILVKRRAKSVVSKTVQQPKEFLVSHSKTKNKLKEKNNINEIIKERASSFA